MKSIKYALAFGAICLVVLTFFPKVNVDAKINLYGTVADTPETLIILCDYNTDSHVALDILNGYLPVTPEALRGAVEQGRMYNDIPAFIMVGLLPEDFVYNGPNNSVTVSTLRSSQKSSSQSASPPQESPAEGTYVVISDCKTYDSFSNPTESGSLQIGTEVSIISSTTNGYYGVENNSYIKKSNVATKEDYEAAWSVTEEIPATCTEAGSTKSVNALSGEEREEAIEALGHDYAMTDHADPNCTEAGYNTFVCNACGDTYTEELEATGHEAGEPAVTVEPKSFSKGVRTTCCSVCGEVLIEEELPQTFPLPLWGVSVIGIAVAGVIAGGTFAVLKRKKKLASSDGLE